MNKKEDIIKDIQSIINEMQQYIFTRDYTEKELMEIKCKILRFYEDEI